MRYGQGGWLMLRLYDLSALTVTKQGIGTPGLLIEVFRLKSFTNAEMLMPIYI